jgi:membrane protein DedA with SNARE-associated domain
MQLHEIISYIHDYGYGALFFCLWLGIIGMPIPDEMVVMTGGFVTSMGILKPIPAFLVTYIGVVSGLSIGYIIGRLFGTKVLDPFMKRKKQGYYIKSQEMMDRYGKHALVISYFIPVVRHIVPYLTGINHMPYRTYALYSYATAFVWILAYFIIGNIFGDNIEIIVKFATKYSVVLGAFASLAIIFVYNFRQEKMLGRETHE